MASYNFTQTTASTTWTITHNLNNTYPNVDVQINTPSGLTKSLPFNIVPTDANTLTITFTDPQTGQARIIA